MADRPDNDHGEGMIDTNCCDEIPIPSSCCQASLRENDALNRVFFHAAVN